MNNQFCAHLILVCFYNFLYFASGRNTRVARDSEDKRHSVLPACRFFSESRDASVSPVLFSFPDIGNYSQSSANRRLYPSLPV